MLVILNTTMSRPGWTATPGTVLDLPEHQAQDMMATGHAEPYVAPQPLPPVEVHPDALPG